MGFWDYLSLWSSIFHEVQEDKNYRKISLSGGGEGKKSCKLFPFDFSDLSFVLELERNLSHRLGWRRSTPLLWERVLGEALQEPGSFTCRAVKDVLPCFKIKPVALTGFLQSKTLLWQNTSFQQGQNGWNRMAIAHFSLLQGASML